VVESRRQVEERNRMARELELGPLPHGWLMLYTEEGAEYFSK
jgi:hypothetical protein